MNKDTPLNKARVNFAYRLFLDRKPAPEEVERVLSSHSTIKDLRNFLLKSVEFRNFHTNGHSDQLSNDKIFLHLHIPKTAGTSLNELLHASYPKSETLAITEASKLEVLNTSAGRLDKLRIIRGHFLYGLHDFLGRDFKYLVVLRRPAERIYSFYRFVKRSKSHPLHDVVQRNNMTFGGFLKLSEEHKGLAKELNNGQCTWLAGVSVSNSFEKKEVTFRAACSNLFDSRTIARLTEFFSDFVERLKDEGILTSASERKVNVSTEGQNFEDAIGSLDEKEQTLMRDYCEWDNRLYSMAMLSLYGDSPDDLAFD